MAYSAGDTILDDEYNNFVNSSSSPFGYNHFAGTGSANYGLGQSAIATVSAGGTINASSWNTLFTGMTNIANHTNDTMTSRSAVSGGDAIAIKAAVATDLATLAASIAAGSPNATATSDADQGTSTNSGTWRSSSTIERSVTFASANAMRHFFNAGGSIRIDPGISGTTVGAKDSAYSSLTGAVGHLSLRAHTTTIAGDGGETRASFDTSNGFFDLGTSYTSKVKYGSTDYTSNYSSNFIEISAKLNNAASGGSATVLTIKSFTQDTIGDVNSYSAGNLEGTPTDQNDAPAMTLNILAVCPSGAEGLEGQISPSSNAQVSNSTA
tara:strand:- start:588 stop:1559 length:972 start_codon:yes stop_codon:yes gene_type:complete